MRSFVSTFLLCVSLCIFSSESTSAAQVGGVAEGGVRARLLLRSGDTVITEHSFQTEVVAELMQSGMMSERSKRKRAGTWSERDEKVFTKLARQLQEVVRGELINNTIITELVRSTGYKTDELSIDLHLNRLIKLAGDIKTLERKHGRPLAVIREKLVADDMQKYFLHAMMPSPARPGPLAMSAYFEKNRTRFLPPPDVKLRIIILDGHVDKAEGLRQARILRDELADNPSTFASVAKQKSIDSATNLHGGLLDLDSSDSGWLSMGKLASKMHTLYQIVSTMKKGEVSNVLPMPIGNRYLILYLEDMRKIEEVSFNDVSEQVALTMMKEEREKLLLKWVAHYAQKLFVANSSGDRIEFESK